jgi:hypothetical protein
VQRRTQERIGSPFKRRDDFLVVVETGGVLDREVSPTRPDFGTLLRVASSNGLTLPLPAN